MSVNQILLIGWIVGIVMGFIIGCVIQTNIFVRVIRTQYIRKKGVNNMKEVYVATVYKKIISKATVNVKAESRKEAKEIAEKFVKDLEYKRQPNHEYYVEITGGTI